MTTGQRDRAIWVINSACPSRCKYCDIASQRDNQELDRAQAIDVAQQLVDLGFKQVIFVGGEPLLYKHLGAVLEVLRGKVDAAVFTGGIPGDHSRYLEALEHGANRVVYSIDSGQGKINDKMRGRLGTTLDLLRFARAVKEHLPSVEASVSTVVSRHTVEFIESVWKRMSPFGLTAWVAVLAGDNFTGTPVDHFLSIEQVQEFYLSTAPGIARTLRQESPSTDFLVFPVPLPFLRNRRSVADWADQPVDTALMTEFENYTRGDYNQLFSKQFGCPLVGRDVTLGVGGQVYPCSQAPIIKDEYVQGSLRERRLLDVLNDNSLLRFQEAVPHAACSRCWAPSNVPPAILRALFS